MDKLSMDKFLCLISSKVTLTLSTAGSMPIDVSLIKMLGHSHTRLFLLNAVVSQGAGGSGWQDVQEDVHLWTKYQTASLQTTRQELFFRWVNLIIMLTLIKLNSDGRVHCNNIFAATLMRSSWVNMLHGLQCWERLNKFPRVDHSDLPGLTDTTMAMGPAKLQIRVSYMESQQKSGFP